MGIPKVIHYCWFGGNPLDNTAQKCIASWKKFFPDYQIIQWNENNFDISQIDFMRQAYDAKKWAFVSDVARLLIIYEHGGIYFDTDVEVIKPFTDILKEDTSGFLGSERTGQVNSGLGFAAEAHHPFIKKHIDIYKTLVFNDYINCLSDIACPIITTHLLEEEGFISNNTRQNAAGFDIYPSTYFAPLDYLTGKLAQKKETHSIHWFSASWQEANTKSEHQKMMKLRRVFGTHLGEMIYGCVSCIQAEGFFPYCKKRVKKLVKW